MAMFQIGGTIGAIIVGWVMDKARPAFVIGLTCSVGCASL
jgi:AAHS family 4-hydroxybenzoate transporter-like MFS transporter